eukprot:m.39663 g.39663  ORF g.39663 m.39663 type:complete len:322 (-) comp12691_c0_seq1:149-1114(-)
MAYSQGARLLSQPIGRYSNQWLCGKIWSSNTPYIILESHNLSFMTTEADLADAGCRNVLLCHAAIVDNVDVAIDMLNLSADANDQFDGLMPGLNTPMHWACMHRRRSIVRRLLRYGGDPRRKNAHEENALHIACQRGALFSCKELLRWADLAGCLSELLEATNMNQHTPLHLACEQADWAVVELLISYGANIEAADLMGALPLHFAARFGVIDSCYCLLLSVDVPDYAGYTPLKYAVWAGQHEMAWVLLGFGADPSSHSNLRRCTPGHWAAHVNDVRMLQILHHFRADFSIRNKRRRTPFEVAKEEHCVEAAEYLASINAV